MGRKGVSKHKSGKSKTRPMASGTSSKSESSVLRILRKTKLPA
jgi:hypothetical protein